MKKIKVEKKMVEYLEMLSFETESRKSLLGYLIERGISLDSQEFQDYHKEYREWFVKYELAKRELEKQYVLPASEGKSIPWSLDFASGELTF